MRYPTSADTPDRDRIRILWEELLRAHTATFGRSARSDEAALHLLQAYRNGLLDAFVLITGQDPEQVHERVTDAIVADHERAIAAQVDG